VRARPLHHGSARPAPHDGSGVVRGRTAADVLLLGNQRVRAASDHQRQHFALACRQPDTSPAVGLRKMSAPVRLTERFSNDARQVAIPRSSGRGGSNRSSSSAGERTCILAAANSMANGNPSSRRQTASAAWAFTWSSKNAACTCRARSPTSATAPLQALVCIARSCSLPGNAHGGTAIRIPELRCKRARLVASTVSPGHASFIAISLAAGRTCSKLSCTRRKRQSRKAVATTSESGRCAVSRRSRTRAMAARMSPGSWMDASGTNALPPGSTPRHS
jgi:hypothetical protein